MSIDLYEVRPRKDRRGFDLIFDALPFGPLWYSGPNAIGYAIHPAAHILLWFVLIVNANRGIVWNHRYTATAAAAVAVA